MPNLFQLDTFVLHSGESSKYKIDCDALTSADLECIAYLFSLRLPPFGSVEGVPTGGVFLASKMKKYITDGPLLIVDDVLTTGNSLISHRNGREAIGAVIFSRGTILPWVTSLFTLAPEYVKKSINKENTLQQAYDAMGKLLAVFVICPLCGRTLPEHNLNCVYLKIWDKVKGEDKHE